MQQLTDAVFLWKGHEDGQGALRKLIAPVESILGAFSSNHLSRMGLLLQLLTGHLALARPGVVSIDERIERGNLVVSETLKGEAVA